MKKDKFLTKGNLFLTNKKCPMLDFLNNERKILTEDKQSEFASLGRAVTYNYIFLKKIIVRIFDDVEINGKYWDTYYRFCDPNDEGFTLTDEDKEILSLGDEVLENIHLDVADFFIHANVFVDQLCRISCFFLKIHVRSFSTHKKSIENQKLPEKYKKYIKEMSWYDQYLKTTRDDFVIHPYNTFWASSTSGSDLTGVSKISFVRKNLTKELELLKKKYPSIDNDESYGTILEKLKINQNKLDKKDKTKLNNIERFWGKEFPSIDLITKEIFDYMKFIQEYFENQN